MEDKRFSIKEGSSVGLSSIYTDNGKVMTQLEVLDVLINQHKTIKDLQDEVFDWKESAEDYLRLGKSLKKENEQLKTVINRYEKYSNKKNDELNFRQLDILQLKEENEQLKFQLKECREHKLYNRRKLEKENEELKKKRVFPEYETDNYII